MRTEDRVARFEPVVAPDVPRRILVEELLVVLSLSLLPSAIEAIRSFTQAPVNKSIAVFTAPQAPALIDQLLPILFALPPVWLVFYLLRRNRESAATIGMGLDRPLFDLGWGAGLAAVVGAAGVGVYYAATALNINRIVVPVPPLGQWWTVPILVLFAAQNALVEETIAIGFMVTRVRQIGYSAGVAVLASALLRGTYHLYQGWGGFSGNFAMGLFFGYIFVRWRRTWPLVIAHTLLDVGAGLGYIYFRNLLPHLSAG